MPGLLSEGGNQGGARSLSIAQALVSVPVEASPADPVLLSDSQTHQIVLAEWPDLFGMENSSGAVGEPRGERGPLEGVSASPTTPQLSPPILPEASGKENPQRQEPGNQENSSPSAPAESIAVAASEGASEELQTSESAQVAEGESPPLTREANSTPSTTGTSTSDDPANQEKNKPGKGYRIKAEGGALVVYDAEGNVVLRKDKSKRTPVSEKQTSREKAVADSAKPEEKVEESRDLLPSNGLSEPPVFVTVKKGENLSVIAARYEGVNADDLIRVNQIANPCSIQIGQKIWVPTNNIEGVCHTVAVGETLSDLEKKYEIESLFEVCDVNGLSRTQNELEPGTLLIMPGAKPRPLQVAGGKSKAVKPDLSGIKGKVTWACPLEAEVKVSSPYGMREDPFAAGKGIRAGGEKNRLFLSMHHGMDLAVPSGSPVYAARGGKVTRRGWRGPHGRSVTVLHDDGWSTVYSHLSGYAVEVGDEVEQGNLLAYSGNTGRSTGPHLHFEIRRPDQKSVNPRSLLGTILDPSD